MKIARVFFDCDMRCGFDGLKGVMQDAKMDVNNIPADQFVVFMNRATTSFKLLAGKDYLVYYTNGYRRIPLEAIKHLPEVFNGKRLDFARAIEKTVKEKLRIS